MSQLLWSVSMTLHVRYRTDRNIGFNFRQFSAYDWCTIGHRLRVVCTLTLDSEYVLHVKEVRQVNMSLVNTAYLNFLFLSLCVYLFKNCPQFLSYWESAKPEFCSEELSSLPCRNQNKSLTLSYVVGKFEFVENFTIKHFFHRATSTILNV